MEKPNEFDSVFLKPAENVNSIYYATENTPTKAENS